MMDKNWASGTVPDDSKTSIIGAWIFAVLWNAVAWPTLSWRWCNMMRGR